MNKSPVYNKDQKNAVPLAHYRALYKTLDPGEIARRCGLTFDGVAFSLRLMGTEYRAAFPEFEVRESAGVPGLNPYEQILIIHYLCEGKYFPPQGKQLSYNEIPWGNVYYRNFEGRCLKRLAYAFGSDLEGLRRIMEEGRLTPQGGTDSGALDRCLAPRLNAEPLPQGDAGYRFEFLNGLYLSIILWAGDDEFPPSAQMLFDDNFVFAFTAEDLAAAGEVVIDRLKRRRKGEL